MTWAITFALGSGGDFVIASGPGWDSDRSALSVILVGTRPASLTCLHFQWICSSLAFPCTISVSWLLTPLPTPQWLRSRLGSGFPSCQSGLIIFKYKPLSSCNHSFGLWLMVLYARNREMWDLWAFNENGNIKGSRNRKTWFSYFCPLCRVRVVASHLCLFSSRKNFSMEVTRARIRIRPNCATFSLHLCYHTILFIRPKPDHCLPLS